MKTNRITCKSGTMSTAAFAALALASAHAQVTIDGLRNGSDVGYTERAVQATLTNWGSNNALANLHTAPDGTNLAVFIGGRPDGNAYLLFIDSKAGGVTFIPNNLITGDEQGTINNLGTSPTTGLTFESGFAPDYALRIYGAGTDSFVRRFDLQTGASVYVGQANVTSPPASGFVSAIRSSWASSPQPYDIVANGVEMRLGLANLGVPLGSQTVKLMAILVNGGSDYASNQVLASRTSSTGDIGAGINSIDFEAETDIQTITVPVTNTDVDTDGDGTPNSIDTDDDNDGLLDTVETNTGIFVNAGNTGTDPLVADTDGDGLKDGVETNTGTFVSVTNTGTNPLNGDTDGDSVKDGAEVLTYGTNPFVLDSDGDGESDGTEVFQGTNPASSASSSAILGLPLIDGTKDSALYGTPRAVQTIQTGFGDNASEWNAAYSYVKSGKLYLMLTGNLENNFNKLEIFIDSKNGGSTTFTSAGNDGSNNMNGMIFDTVFEPDYHLIVRRGLSKLDLDIANLGTPAFSALTNLFGGTDFGRGISLTGPANTVPLKVGYDGSNVLGVGGDTGVAANQDDAVAVSTGLELCIDLADIGSPDGQIKVMILQNSGDHSFLSNQSLSGLPEGTLNLGSPSGVNFSQLAGDQFFTVETATPSITAVQLLSANTQIQLSVKGLIIGKTYRVADSTTLAVFTDIPGSEFIADAITRNITLPVAPGSVPKRFFRVRDVP